MAVSDAPGNPLKDHLAPTTSYLQAVAVLLCFRIISHEPQESDVHRCHAQLKCLEMQAEVLAKAAENLHGETLSVYLA